MKPRSRRTPRCHNCRQRKIKCDYQRPQCGKCISSNLQCQGYGGRFIFVSCNDDNDGTAVPSPRQAEDTPETRLAAPAPDPSKLLKDNRFRFFDCFLAEYTPQRSALREHSLEWMVQLTDRPGSSSPLENAANALGTMVVARGSHRSDMLTAGMRLYGSSMSELAVERLTRVNWLNTLMTALLLQIYEAIESSGPSGDGWMRHAIGICCILNCVGPAAVQEGLAHEIFLCCRLSVTLGSIVFERPTILAAQDWRSVPWERQPKNDLHRLLDILSLLPHLLLGSNELPVDSATGTRTPRQIETFFSLHKHLDYSLNRWLQGLEITRDRSLFWPKPTRNRSTAKLFGHQLEYANLADSHLLTLYWEAKLRCHEAVQRVVKREDLRPSLGSMGEVKAPIGYLIECADRICQSVAYMQSQDFGILGMHFTIYPILAARRFYEETGLGEKSAFCDAVVGEMARRPFSLFSKR